ncbi:MAG: succinylglutamate desuccinylase/aspartoacylase family protein [Rhodanobacteraceae bacterium]
MLARDQVLTVGDEAITAGTRCCVDVPVVSLYHAPLSMPVQVVRGRRSGPVLFVSAALHGDELNGVEIIRRLLRMKALKELRGCLLAVPIVNVQGFLMQSRYLPDRRDLNRSFPGSEKGSLASRLAHVFLHEVVERSDFGIDLHTGGLHRPNLPQIRGDLEHPDVLRMARAFGVPLILNSSPRPGSLREYTSEHQIPALLYESGEALRFDELAIRTGVRGVMAVMRELGMLPARTKARTPAEVVVAHSSSWIRAPASGILRTQVRLGERVRPGQELAWVSDPFVSAEVPVVSTEDGVVIGRTHLPPVNEGDALFHIAHVDEPRATAALVKQFRAEAQTSVLTPR